MALYDDALTTKEKNALKKHTGKPLEDEISLLQILIKRGLDENDLDIETMCKALDSLSKAQLAMKKLQTKPDDELKLAFMTALNVLDTDGEPN
jgi:hypothetical protein